MPHGDMHYQSKRVTEGNTSYTRVSIDVYAKTEKDEKEIWSDVPNVTNAIENARLKLKRFGY